MSPELLSQFEGDANLHLDVINKTGSMGWLRMNCLQPPFSSVKARQAMLHLIDQAAIIKASFGDPRYYRACNSFFSCGTTMENDANTGWAKGGQDIRKAAALFKEAGYDGTPLVIMQQTTSPVLNNASLLIAQWLRQAGVKAELVPLDWAGIFARRAKKGPAPDGGWNIFLTSASGSAYDNPITLAGDAAIGEKGWFGWPEDARHEQLRDAWASAPDLAARQKIARELQESLGLAYLFISHDMAVVERVSHRVAVMYLGEFVEIGPRRAIFEAARHPYTRKLMAAVPVPDPARRRLRRNLDVEEIKSPLRAAGYVPPKRRYEEVTEGHFVQVA